MATLITEPASTNPETVDWQNILSKLVKVSGGFYCAMLSNTDSTLEPVILSGSRFEINGSFYQVTADESITGWSGISVSTLCYVYAVPGTGSATFIYSSTAPTWDTAKGGYFNGTSRALFSIYKTSVSLWADKQKIQEPGANTQKIYNHATGNGMFISNNSTGRGVSISNATGIGIYVSNSSGGTGSYIYNSSSGYGVYIENTSTGRGVYISNSSGGYGLYLDNLSVGLGISVINSSNGKGIYVLNSSTGSGVYVVNQSSAAGIVSVNTGSGKAVAIENTSTGIGVYIYSNNAGYGLSILSEGTKPSAKFSGRAIVLPVKTSANSGGMGEAVEEGCIHFVNYEGVYRQYMYINGSWRYIQFT